MIAKISMSFHVEKRKEKKKISIKQKAAIHFTIPNKIKEKND